MLCRVGIALEGVYPLVHVCAGRTVLCFGGKPEAAVPQKETDVAFDGGGAFDHTAGARLRIVSQPQLPGVGLPKDATEFSWTDLLALYPAVGAHQHWGYAPIPHRGTEEVMQ